MTQVVGSTRTPPDPARPAEKFAAGDRQLARTSLARNSKVEQRRAQLAASALQTLSTLGYARTSLREIAQNSDFSHGVLHYYFRDKIDLISYSVRQYKAECVTRYDELIATAQTADELLTGFGTAMARTLVDDAAGHHLWYDMRTQAFFEPSFRSDVIELDASLAAMIWRVVSRYSELADARVTVSPAVAYALFDGLFQQGLLKHLNDPGAPAQLKADVEALLAGLLAHG